MIGKVTCVGPMPPIDQAVVDALVPEASEAPQKSPDTGATVRARVALMVHPSQPTHPHTTLLRVVLLFGMSLEANLYFNHECNSFSLSSKYYMF